MMGLQIVQYALLEHILIVVFLLVYFAQLEVIQIEDLLLVYNA